MINKTFDY